LSGGYTFDGRIWRGFDPDSDQRPDIAAPWLSVYIHDSDIATVRYEPSGPGSGIAYLGYTPRTYFADESASAPADVRREAEGLALWLARQQGRDDEAELREQITSFLAADIRDQQLDDDASIGDDAGVLDDADIFVEVKVSRFLNAIGLPIPHELPSSQRQLTHSFAAARLGYWPRKRVTLRRDRRDTAVTAESTW
jgi:hypothetical protein